LKATVLIGKERTYQAWYGVPQDSLSTQRTYNPAGYYTQIGSEKADFYNNQTDNYTQNHYQLFYTYHFNNNMQIGATLYRSTGAGYYQEYQDNKKWSDFNLQNPMLKDTANNTITNLDIITQRWLSNVNDGINAAFNWHTGKFTLDAGANVGVYKGSHFGNISWAQYNPVALDSNFINPNVSTNNSQTVLYYLNFAKKTDASAFVKSSYGFFRNKMIVFADVQARYVSYDFAPKPYNVLNPPTQNVQYLFINPKLGATYAPNSRHSVYAYYGIANREPAREDMVNAPENQRPTPENLQNIELGYRYVKSKMNLELNAYLMQYKNQMVLTGAINDVGEFTRVNVAQSYRRGIELSGGYGSGKLALNGNIALSQNKIRNFDEYAPDYINGKNIWIKTHKNTDISFAPAVVASLALSLKPISNLPVIEWNTKYVGSQYMDNTMNANRRIAAYWTHSLRLTQSYKFTNNIKELGWAVQANNLLNAIYNNNGYTYSYYYNRPADPTLYTSNNYFPQATRHLMVMFFVKI
jgi:iron complex outermembrane receptor protein